jgi:hypothetical protein
MLRFIVAGPCKDEDAKCDCKQFHLAPIRLGTQIMPPPLHEGCTCYVTDVPRQQTINEHGDPLLMSLDSR